VNAIRKFLVRSIAIILVASFSSCIDHKRKRGGIRYSASYNERYQFVYPEDKSKLPNLSKNDYDSFERVVNKIYGIGNPVIVEEIIPASRLVINSVLIRTEQHEIYLVRGHETGWIFSEVMHRPSLLYSTDAVAPLDSQ